MKKILSLVVVVAAVAMVSCAGNNTKKAEATCEPAACAQCDEAATCPEAAAPAAEAPAEAPAEVPAE